MNPFMLGGPILDGKSILTLFLYVIGVTILAYLGVIVGAIMFALSFAKKYKKHTTKLRLVALILLVINLLFVFSPLNFSKNNDSNITSKEENSRLNSASFTVYLPKEYTGVSLSAQNDHLTFRSAVEGQRIYVTQSEVNPKEITANGWKPLVCNATDCQTINKTLDSSYNIYFYQTTQDRGAYITRLGDTKINIYPTSSSYSINDNQATKFFNSLLPNK